MGSIAAYIQEAQRNALIPMEALQEEMPEVDEAQKSLAELLSDVNVVELVTPTGVAMSKKGEAYPLETYKEEWLREAEAGRWQDPVFHYNMELAEKVAGRRSELNAIYDSLAMMLGITHSQLEKLRLRLLLNRVSSALGATYLASGILYGDDRAALGGSIMRYNRFAQTRGIGWQDLVEWARIGLEDLRDDCVILGERKITIQQESALRKMKLDAREIAKWFEFAVSQYGFDYAVEVDTEAAAIDVRETSSAGYPRIVIPASRKMHGLKLVTLVRHEIDCHARDSANGRELLWGLGGGALRAEDDVIYEGHAMTAEYAMLRDCTCESPRQALPWYTLAIAGASAGMPFSKVAEEVYKLRLHVGSKKATALKGAWTTTRRVFRGISDARNPYGYAFWKDKAYLQGTLEVGDLYDAGLSHWAELGSFELDELVEIARVVKFRPEDLVHPDLNTAGMVLEKLLG